MSDETEDNQPAERLAVQDFRGDKDSKVFRIAEAINNLIEETEFSGATPAELAKAIDKIAGLERKLDDCHRRLHNQAEYIGVLIAKIQALSADDRAVPSTGPTTLTFGDGTSRVYSRRTATDDGDTYALVIERGKNPLPAGTEEMSYSDPGPGDYVLEFKTGDSAWVFLTAVGVLVDCLYAAEAAK